MSTLSVRVEVTHTDDSCKYKQLDAQFILSIFINLYMFRATMCPSLGETTVFMRHLVLSGMHPAYQTVVSPGDGHIVTRNM